MKLIQGIADIRKTLSQFLPKMEVSIHDTISWQISWRVSCSTFFRWPLFQDLSRLLKSYTRGKKWRLRLRRTKPNLTKNTFIDSRTIEERIPFSVRNLIHRGIYGWICCARKEETGGREVVVALPVRG